MIIVVLLISVILQVWYYVFIFGKLAWLVDKEDVLFDIEPVSILICAKNEAENLKRNLPLILCQDYSVFEVIVIDDDSTDKTNQILSEIKESYPALKVVKFNRSKGSFLGKKEPLSYGIEHAEHEILVFTDADCKPTSRYWLGKMVSNFDKNTDIVLGFSPFIGTNSFLNKVICFDALYIAIQYLSFSLFGRTYMGVGRNMAYRKSLWIEVGGFSSSLHLPSGDDDLFINKASKTANVRLEINKNAWTISSAPNSLARWIVQKKRHNTTSLHYSLIDKVLLGGLHLSAFLFYGSIIYLLLAQEITYQVIGLVLIRFLFQYMIIKKCFMKLGGQNLLLFSPLFEFFGFIINGFATASNLFLRHNKWK